ncbi:ETS homologous factor-like [Ylistrum balloti]|uniref:ETS homologous factor-like n=1 Tax=Ylistrum balloti TaxID=509963 RepID=UPI002905827D|nr:ETS homologous factor-like [Ylistrum balloti]
MHNTNKCYQSPRRNRRSEVFHGILAAHIFPSLADVLTEPLEGTDEFGPLDLSVRNMDEATSALYPRGLAEEDFLNPNATDIQQHGLSGECETDIQELSSPGDLLVPLPLWSEGDDKYDDNCEVGLVEYEIMASVDNTDPPCYPHSPGSVGDLSDYSSDCSVEPGLETCTPETMIELGKVDVRSHMQNAMMPKVKIEPQNLPDDSVFKPYYCSNGYEDGKRDVMDLVDTYEEEDCSSDSSIKSVDKEKRKRPGRKKGQTSSVYHLWEFIRDLLQNPQHCPKIIKWEDEEEGIFRVLKSTEVAKEWGSMKKNKTAMTYEKLSRSLRYSRKEGYFDDIPKDRGLPKKLCFKFGPKSHGWKRHT